MFYVFPHFFGIFGNLIASAICEGIAASFYDAEGNPQPPENAEKMRENIEHCLDYVEELIDGNTHRRGKYAHHTQPIQRHLRRTIVAKWLYSIGSFAARRAWAVIAIWCLLLPVLPVAIAHSMGS